MLSIGYIVVDERRSTTDSDAGGDDAGRASLTTSLARHDTLVVAAVTVFFAAGLAHWYLRATESFSPVLLWGTAAFVVVVTAISRATDE